MNDHRLVAGDLIGAEILNVATNEDNLSEFITLLVRTAAGEQAEIYISGPGGEYLKAVAPHYMREEDVNE